MDTCKFSKQIIYAAQVAEDFEFEKTVRSAGSDGLLFCAECNRPVIYNHGAIKLPYFSHKNNNDACDYSEFSRFNSKRSQEVRQNKKWLYDFFREKFSGYVVYKDKKLIEKHWTDIAIFSKEKNNYFAIDIEDKTTSSKRYEEYSRRYIEEGIVHDVIVLDDVKPITKDINTFYIKRKQLNDSHFNMAFVVYVRTKELGVYKMDKGEYVEDRNFHCAFLDDNVYFKVFSLEDIFIAKNGLKVLGFDEEYKQWRNDRIAFYQRNIVLAIEESKKYLKLRNKMNSTDVMKKSTIAENLPASYSKNNQDALRIRNNLKAILTPQIELEFQNEEDRIIEDLNGIRWYKCVICDCIKEGDDMNSYGGKGMYHLGQCSACVRLRRGGF